MAKPLNRADRDALWQAIVRCREERPARAKQINDKIAPGPWHRGWIEVAEFCSYSTQVDSLGLAPWQIPPCWIDDIDAALREPGDDAKRIRDAALLLLRMQRCGVSKFHPDPIGACAIAEAAQPS